MRCGGFAEIAIAHTLAVHCGGGGDGFDVVCNAILLLLCASCTRYYIAGTCASTKLIPHSLYMCFVVNESFRFRRGV